METKLIKKGATGKAVKELQNLLKLRLGSIIRLKEDGVFGMNTWRAVLMFQKREWLVEDGQAGPCTWAALRQREKYKILHPVFLIPQHDSSACWLAATSMLLKMSFPRSSVPSSLLAGDGGLLNDSELNSPVHTEQFAKHFNLHMYYPMSWTAEGLASLLRRGPLATHILWNVSGYLSGMGSSGHFAVIAGIRGDGTSLGTTLRIYDPWPVNRGKISSFGYYKLMHGTPALTYQLFQAKR
jgi:hypothetical protein